MFVGQTNPEPQRLVWEGCNLSQPSPDFDGEGVPEPVRMWAEDDLLTPENRPQRLVKDCLALNCKFGDNVRFEGTVNTQIVQKNVDLGATTEYLIDGTPYRVPRRGTRDYGSWDTRTRQTVLRETPLDTEAVV
jgi:hypothetical protein